MKTRIERLKWAFYGWLGALSTQEIMNNAQLMENARNVERLLAKLKA